MEILVTPTAFEYARGATLDNGLLRNSGPTIIEISYNQVHRCLLATELTKYLYRNFSDSFSHCNFCMHMFPVLLLMIPATPMWPCVKEFIWFSRKSVFADKSKVMARRRHNFTRIIFLIGRQVYIIGWWCSLMPVNTFIICVYTPATT